MVQLGFQINALTIWENEMKILVTGASGLLGGSITKILKLQPYDIATPTSEELNLLNYVDTLNFLKTDSPDLVIHCAAKVSGIMGNLGKDLEQYIDNVTIDSNLTRACLATGVENVISFGSSCMYPRAATQPFRVNDLFGGPFEESNRGYGLAKASLAQTFLECRARGLNFTCLVLSNIYGEGERVGPNSHLVASATRKISRAIRSGKKVVEIWGTGNALREFTYAKDVAEWVVDNLSEIETFPGILNLGSGEEYSVTGYYKIIAKVAGWKGEFRFVKEFPDGMPRKMLDSDVARQSFGWRAKTPFEVGVLQFYDWVDRNEGKTIDAASRR